MAVELLVNSETSRKAAHALIDLLYGQGCSVLWAAKDGHFMGLEKVQKALTGEESTKDIYSDDVTLIYETVNRHSSEKLGVSVLFPSEENRDDHERPKKTYRDFHRVSF